MNIKLKGNYANLNFDTEQATLVSVPSKEKYHQVDIALTPEKNCDSVVIATLEFSQKENFEDLKKLGEEIARRWNANK